MSSETGETIILNMEILIKILFTIQNKASLFVETGLIKFFRGTFRNPFCSRSHFKKIIII